MAVLPNYNNDVIMRTQATPAPTPGSIPFANIDPVTGKPKMLGTGVNTGALNLKSLIGAGPNATLAPGIPGLGGGAGTMPVPGAAGTTGATGTPAAPGVDASGQLPNYVLNQVSGNLSSELKGELPADVQNMLAQQAAEYGVGSGTQGSQFQGYRGLRNLGLTSLDLQKHAEDLLAGQFTKPAEKTALDQSAQKLKDLENQFQQSYGLDKQKLETELKLEKDKFAEMQNEFNKKYELEQLQSLGLKYGGGAGVGGGLPALPKYSEDFIPVPFGGF